MDVRLQNSLTEGDFGNGMVLRQSLTEGDFWTLRSGCYLVYRGLDHMKTIDYDQIIACTESQGYFTLPNYLVHEPGKRYFYSARRISGSGKGEWGTEAVVTASFDDQSELRPNRPNCICSLNAQQRANGRVYLSWWYWPIGQRAVCDHFLVFSDQGTGSVDYENPIAQINNTGRHLFNYLSDPITNNQTCRFCVRSVSPEGIDDGSLSCVLIQVRLMSPVSIEGVGQIVSF